MARTSLDIISSISGVCYPPTNGALFLIDQEMLADEPVGPLYLPNSIQQAECRRGLCHSMRAEEYNPNHPSLTHGKIKYKVFR